MKLLVISVMCLATQLYAGDGGGSNSLALLSANAATHSSQDVRHEPRVVRGRPRESGSDNGRLLQGGHRSATPAPVARSWSMMVTPVEGPMNRHNPSLGSVNEI